MGHRLTKIYTRTGDDGSTGLADGNRVEKDSLRVDAIGDIDELNSLLGVLTANDIPDDIKGYLLNIQHRLFDLGGELAIPGDAAIEPESISRIEELIDNFNDDLPMLKEFILPGGNMPGSVCHLARAVCRRGERKLVKLARDEYVNPVSITYINRLSDLLFVFARVLARQKSGREIFWDKNRLKNSV